MCRAGWLQQHKVSTIYILYCLDVIIIFQFFDFILLLPHKRCLIISHFPGLTPSLSGPPCLKKKYQKTLLILPFETMLPFSGFHMHNYVPNYYLMSHNCTVIISASEFPAIILVIILLLKAGRRLTLLILYLICGFSLLATMAIPEYVLSNNRV